MGPYGGYFYFIREDSDMKNKTVKKFLAATLVIAMAGAISFGAVYTNGLSNVYAAGTTSSTSSDSTPPDLPDGDSGSGEAPSGEAPSGEAPDGDAPSGDAPENSGSGGGSSSAVTEWSAITELSEDTESTDETYTSTGTDENAIHVLGGVAQFNNVTIDRTSSDSTGGDNSSFYGVGAALLTTAGTSIVNGGTITTDSAGGAGIFSYGDGITYVQGVSITTQQDTSGGIHVAGGGTLYAWGLEVETNGGSAAAIRSDRGGGTMVVDGGTYTSNGSGSPAIYCTADITVNDATLTANGSEGICIEGLNTLRLFDSDLTSNMPDDDQNDNTWSIILYQSMSGDSEEGNSTFTMVGGSVTSENGGLLYTTNTESTILLSDVDITMAEDAEFFLQVTGNTNERGWGTEGENGADCNFTADNQVMEGDIIYDSISQLDFYMTNGSTLTGAFIDDESYAGSGGDGEANVYISEDSTWTVTGDSTVTNLYNEGTIVDEDGNTVTIEGTDGTVYVEGDSEYTITVESYSEEADFSGATETPSYSDYEVEKPDTLTAELLGTDTTTSDADAADTADTTTETANNALPYVVGGIVAVVAAIVAAGIVFFRKRKK